jgi:hypothetical protein
MLVWNFIPYYEYDHSLGAWIQDGLVIIKIWPKILEKLLVSMGRTPATQDVLHIILHLALIFLVSIQFLLAPLWRVVSASRLLRFIPACICMLGLIVIIYFTIPMVIHWEVIHSIRARMHYLITLNFLLSLLALLLYHPEPIPEPES